MKFSSQEEYGLRCLVRIAQSETSLTIPEIATAEGLSSSHVAKLLAILRRAGYLKSIRGQAGGYKLGKEPSLILISSVLEALGGRLVSTRFCSRHSGIEPVCVHEGTDCLVQPVWSVIQFAVDRAIHGKTLKDVLDQTFQTGPNTLFREPVLGKG